jgi:hypothetical protein
MIKKFFNTLLNTEYLPMNDVRKIKIIIIFIFLSLFTIFTIPVSSLLDYPVWVKSIFIAGFVLTLFLTLLFLKVKKIFLAMQTTIVQAVLFMIYYTQGITSFYAYLLFYVVLTVIALYQEIYSYFVYGTFVTVLGVFYILGEGEGLLIASDLAGAIYIYMVSLILYYLVNFAFIFINEKSYTEMNIEWINDKKTNDAIQEDIFNYMEALRKVEGLTVVHDDPDFQKAIYDISEFIAKQVMKDGSEIKNLVDLYFYMHENGYQSILDNQDISVNMRKTTIALKKYMINDNSDLFSMIINFSLKEYASNNHMDELTIDHLSELKDERLIAFALIYVYIVNNLQQSSQWNSLDEDQKMKAVEDFDFEPFLDEYTMAFFQDNIDIIKKYLNK